MANLKKSVGAVGLLKIVSIVLSLVYVPVVLSYLGDYKYGVWATLLGILTWVSYFDVGIGNGLRNKLTESIARGEDSDCIKSLVSSAYFLFGLILASATIVLLIVFAFIDWESLLSAFHLGEPLLAIIELSLTGMALGFIFSLCNSLYYAIQKPYFVNLIGVVQQLFMIVSVFMLSCFGTGSLTMVAIAYVFSNILVYLIFTVVLFGKYPQFAPSVRMIDKDQAGGLIGIGVGFFVIQMAAIVLNTTDNIVVSNLFGPSQVTVYSTALKVFTAFVSVFSASMVPYWSLSTVALAEKNYVALRNSIKSMLKYFAIALLLDIVLVIAFKPLVNIWLGRDLNFDLSLIILMGVYAAVYMWNCVFSQVSNGMSLMRFMVVIAAIQAIINIPLSILLATVFGFGVNGVLIGTICAMLISSLTYPPYVLWSISKHEREGIVKSS